MSLRGWRVYVRDADRERVGLLSPTSFTLNYRHNRLGAWELHMDADESPPVSVGDGLLFIPTERDAFDPGDTMARMTGPVTRLERKRDADGHRITLRGVDDLAWVAGRLAYPDPSVALEGDGHTRDVRTGPAEDVIRDYVRFNAAGDALNSGGEDRRVPGFGALSSSGRGATVTGRARMQNLLEFVASLAERGGLGVRAVHNLPGIQFSCYEPVDRSGEVRFHLDSPSSTGNLRGYEYTVDRPEFTWLIAGGRGELGDRVFRQGDQEVPAWGRIESFLDQRNAGDGDTEQTMLDEMDDAIAERLAEATAAVSIRLDAVDTDAVRWPRDYGLGDKVRVNVDTVSLVKVVREVEVSVDEHGQRVSPTLGDAPPRAVLRMFQRLGELDRRVRHIQRG